MTTGDWESRADELAASSLGAGDATGWFERLYAEGDAGAVPMPWDRETANPLLREWTDRHAITGAGRRAVVVGCGLGADAEHLAALGFATTAFDIAPTAIEVARRRRPGSSVDYVVADVLDLPGAWSHAFDLVVESYTAQAVPDPPRSAVVHAVAGLVAPHGTLLAIASARAASEPAVAPPPWPLTDTEVRSFAVDGVELVELEDVVLRAHRHWRATFRRP